MDLSGRHFERILIIKPSSLGDVIHALPVLHGLRHRFPAARIDWLIGAAFAPLLEEHPELTELVLFDRRRFGRVALSPRVASEFMHFLGDLRARRYDLVIDLQGLFRSGFIARATGAPVRIGFRRAREGASMFYTHRIETPPGDIHAVDKNYLVARTLGFEAVRVSFHVPISASAEAEARALLEDAATNDKPVVCVAPGARWETKRWPADRFVEVIDQLQSSGSRCVLVGGRDDQALSASIEKRCEGAPLNLTGKTSLPALVAIVGRSDLVICHDSGVAHIAAALQRPLICLTGPTNPRRTGPYGREQDVVRLDLECSPCYFRRLSQCPHQHRCMQELSAAHVIEATGKKVEKAKDRKVKRMT